MDVDRDGGAERVRRATMQVESRIDGSSVQWGEFQGTWCRGSQDGDGQDKQLLHGWWTDDRWEAFRDTDSKEIDTQVAERSQAAGQWWCEDSMLLCNGPTHLSRNKESLGWVFEDCFPSYSPPVIEDDIKPLEPPQPASGDLTTSPSHSQSATCLWGAVCDRRTHPNRQCKWEGSKLHNSYLSSLHIDPNDKLPAHKTKFPVTSPALREKQPPHKLSMGKEAELKLMKVASVSVHVSGFSPSHHLQSLFQHWTQPQGKPRLKVAYEFKHSLMA